jgi:hypothetical protein
MEDCRWRSGSTRERVEIGRVNLAIQPRLQAETSLVGIFQRAVTDAMNGVPLIG